MDRPQLRQPFIGPHHHLRRNVVPVIRFNSHNNRFRTPIIHRPAVVRIDQAQIPQLRPLIKSGTPGAVCFSSVCVNEFILSRILHPRHKPLSSVKIAHSSASIQ